MKLKDYIYFEVSFYFLIFFDTFPLYFYKFWFGISCILIQNFAVYFHRILHEVLYVFGSLQSEFWIDILPF
jgi:hypothetical protein